MMMGMPGQGPPPKKKPVSSEQQGVQKLEAKELDVTDLAQV